AMRESADVRRRLRDLYEIGMRTRKLIVLCSAVKEIPHEIERSIVYVELAVPDLPELVAFLRGEAAALTAAGGTVDTSETTVLQLARALQGLTLDDAGHAVRRALAARNALDQQSLPMLLEEKRLLVNRTGMIEFIHDQGGIENIGGLEVMKKWLLER